MVANLKRPPTRRTVRRDAGVRARKRAIPGDTHFRLQRLAEVFREARRASGMSLEDLAERSGVSSGMISQIERGLGNPSFVTLVKLRNALEVPWHSLFQGPRDGKMLVRPRDRQQLRFRDSGLTYELLTPSFGGPYGFFRIHYPPGHDSTFAPTRRQGQYSMHVLRGRIVVLVGQESYELREGDTVTFPASTPHAVKNPGRAVADVVMATSQTG